MKKACLLVLSLGLSLSLFVPFLGEIKNHDEVSYADPTSRIEKYQQESINKINDVDLSIYRIEQVNEIEELIEEITAKISNSSDISEIDSIVSSFNRYLLTIKTDEELTKEETIIGTDNYYISSLNDLLEFRDDVNGGYNYAGETVLLTQDIVIPEGQSFGKPIGNTTTTYFSGTFDGQGHKIVNLKMSDITCAFIYFGTRCTVKNLSFENIDITVTTQRGAGVISRAEEVYLENVHVLSGTINGPRENGGLIGAIVNEKGTSFIKNCSNNANIISKTVASGGAVGYLYSGSLEIENFTNYGSITSGSQSAAGVLGHIRSTSENSTINITNCINNGEITGTGKGTAGIVGFANGSKTTIKNCVNEGRINGKGFGTGGIFGNTSDNLTATEIIIENCTNNGDVVSTSEATGGIFGYDGVNPSTKLSNTIRISDSVNNGDVTGTSNGTGGIAGASLLNSSYTTFIIENSDNYGSINGVNYVAGIAGLIRASKSESYVTNCFNFGDVKATFNNGTIGCGGIVGTARVNVFNCGCYYLINLTVKNISYQSANVNEIGTPGFIGLNYESGCKNHENNRLINLDKSEYKED